MSEDSNKRFNFFKSIKLIINNNFKYFLILLGFLLITFIAYQSYNYFVINEVKKISTQFFNSIDADENLPINIKNKKNIFFTLAKLKEIKFNNSNKNFKVSNEIYKEIISTNKLDDLYITSISAHAAYTLINASYIEDTNNYIDDISMYIKNIDDKFSNYFSIKKELEYLLLLLQIEINNSNYKDNAKIIEVYNSINDSNLISSSIKERINKIHEFQLYK